MTVDRDVALEADMNARLDALQGDAPVIAALAAELVVRHYHRKASEVEVLILYALDERRQA